MRNINIGWITVAILPNASCFTTDEQAMFADNTVDFWNISCNILSTIPDSGLLQNKPVKLLLVACRVRIERNSTKLPSSNVCPNCNSRANLFGKIYLTTRATTAFFAYYLMSCYYRTSGIGMSKIWHISITEPSTVERSFPQRAPKKSLILHSLKIMNVIEKPKQLSV